MRMLHNRRGQNLAEYVILFVVVIAAFLGLAILLKNHLQGGALDRARQLGGRFSPTDTVANWNTTANSNRTETTSPTGVSSSVSQGPESTSFTVTSTVDEDVTSSSPLFK